MGDRDRMKAMLCLAGTSAVGKTSLICRYVRNEFDDRYLATIGTKVSKKEVVVRHPIDGDPLPVDLMVWDIMGQMGFRELLEEKYFQGAQAILAVADITRPDSLDDLYIWIDQIDRIVGPVPIVLAVNKVDLAGKERLDESQLHKFTHAFGCDALRTSAKTGENVEEAFQRLARLMAEGALRRA